jgi:anti-sigma B factor antagonist
VDFSVTTRAIGELSVVDVAGEVDVFSAPELAEQLTQLFDAGRRTVVVDLTSVTFLDSTGLGTLVAARNRAEEAGGQLPIIGSGERVLKLFRITGLDEVFEIYPSIEAAITATTASELGPEADAPTGEPSNT